MPTAIAWLPHARRARHARAARGGAGAPRTLVFPADLEAAAQQDERVQQALAKETALFEARRSSLASEVGLMRAQRERIQQEIVALQAQITQVQSSLALQHGGPRDQPAPGEERLSSPPRRIAQIEAAVVDYAGQAGGAALRAGARRTAAGRQRSEDPVDPERRTCSTASDQLKATAARVGEIEQELRKSEDAAARQVVTAPAGGEVIDLKFTSPGAVVRPGDSIAEIVPSRQPADDRGAHPARGGQPRAARAARAHQVHRVQVPQHLDGDGQGDLRFGRPPDRQGQQPALLQRDDRRRSPSR